MIDHIIKEIIEGEDPRGRDVWQRFGLNPPYPYYGWGITRLKAYAKKLGKNADLARELWGSRVHDAMLLSSFVEEAKKLSAGEIERRGGEFGSHDIADRFGTMLGEGYPKAPEVVEAWHNHPDEHRRRSAYAAASALAKKGKLPPELGAALLKKIAEDIHGEENFVKETMLFAIYTLGRADSALKPLAIQTAEAAKGVMIDYGESSCTQIDPLKMLMR